MQQQQSTVRVKQLLMMPTKHTYRDTYQRGYNIEATPTSLAKLEAVFNQTGVSANHTISNMTIANTMPEIMKLSPTVNNAIHIPNGWGTQRILFLMEVESQVSGSLLSTYIQGYTEYYDPTLTGNIDPNMTFFINSMTNVMRMHDPISNQIISRPMGTYNVITDLAGGRKFDEIEGPGSDMKLARPNDVLQDIMFGDMYGENNSINSTSDVSGNSNVSDRANNDPLKYFTRTLNSYIDAKNDAGVGNDVTDVLRTAVNSTGEGNVLESAFIYELHSRYNNSSTPPSTFTLNMLNGIDPNTAEVSTIVTHDLSPGTITVLDTADTEEMYQPTQETLIATNIANTISGMLVENLLTKVTLSITNQTGTNVTIPTNADSFIEGVDLTSYLGRLVSNVNNVLMPEITHSGLLIVSAHVDSDLMTDTTISISINYGPEVVFRLPTFADSMFTPVVTNAANKLALVDGFNNVLDATYNASY